MGYHNGQKRVQCSMAANNTGVPTDHNREDGTHPPNRGQTKKKHYLFIIEKKLDWKFN